MSEVLSETAPVSDDAAAEALFNAIQADTGRAGYGDEGNGTEAPESKQEQPVTPEDETQEVATAEADTFTKLDPNAIPDELKPWYQSMQADYTRKTQELAGVRKQYESLGEVDPTEAQAALNLFHTLQDPQGALSFHQQLSATLTQMGLTPAQAAVEATRQIEAQQPVTPAAEREWDDPDTAALKSELDQLQNRLSSFENSWSERESELQAREYEAAIYAEWNRQENLIREANPHYNDADFNAISELAAYHGGNLIEAQSRYEDIVTERVNRLMAGKASAASIQGVQAIVPAAQATEGVSFGDNLEAAHKAAMETLRATLADG